MRLKDFRQIDQRNPGKWLTGKHALFQAIGILLTTRVGSRVLRRDFGSGVPDLIDQPFTPGVLSQLTNEITKALRKAKLGFTLTQLHLLDVESNRITLRLVGMFFGESVELAGLTL